MYESLVFAKPIPSRQVVSIDEALEIATELTVTPTTIRLGDLKINDDAVIENKEKHLITSFGFENLSKILGIPRPFARKIPQDLLFTNINRLKANMADTQVCLLERPNGEIANIVKAPYSEVSYLDFLGLFINKEDIKYINIGEKLTTVSHIFQETNFKGPEGESDSFYVGTFLYNSILETKPMQMVSGLYRTLCENSYVMPFFGKLRARYMLEKEQRLIKFAENMRCWDGEILNRLQTNFSTFETRCLFKHEVASIWKRLDRIVGSTEADIILKTDEESRKLVMDEVFVWNMKNKLARLKGEVITEATLTEATAYDVINGIAAYAKNFYEEDKFELERLGGRLIEDIILN